MQREAHGRSMYASITPTAWATGAWGAEGTTVPPWT